MVHSRDIIVPWDPPTRTTAKRQINSTTPCSYQYIYYIMSAVVVVITLRCITFPAFRLEFSEKTGQNGNTQTST